MDRCRGTSPLDVLDARYAFRVRAGHTLSASGGLAYAQVRATSLARAWLTGGLGVLTAAIIAIARHWVRSPVMVALSATVSDGRDQAPTMSRRLNAATPHAPAAQPIATMTAAEESARGCAGT